MIKAVIFDMDGVLIDSEPFWKIAMRNVFKTVGLEMNFDKARQTMGMRIDEAVAHWYAKEPWKGKSQEQVLGEILEEVDRLVHEKGETLPGVHETLDFLESKNLKIALASSSPMGLIKSFVGKMGIESRMEVLRSGEHEEYGKPHPAVFQSTARDLGVAPKECFVIEDSVNGVIAGKAAGMKVVAIPDPENYDDPRFSIADLTLRSMSDFDENTFQKLRAM